MKKSKIIASRNLYCIYDKVADDYLLQYCAYCRSSGEYVRSVLSLVIQNYPIPDIEVRQLLSVDGEKYILCAWDSYKFPESKAENLAPLGITPEEATRIFNKNAKEDSEEIEKEEKADE